MLLGGWLKFQSYFEGWAQVLVYLQGGLEFYGYVLTDRAIKTQEGFTPPRGVALVHSGQRLIIPQSKTNPPPPHSMFLTE